MKERNVYISSVCNKREKYQNLAMHNFFLYDLVQEARACQGHHREALQEACTYDSGHAKRALTSWEKRMKQIGDGARMATRTLDTECKCTFVTEVSRTWRSQSVTSGCS